MKIVKEFKDFISRGNVVDMAVGVIIGAAFQNIVTAFIDYLIMPFIGLLTGGIDFSSQFVILKAPEGIDTSTLLSGQAAADAGCTVWQYGAFISAVINFLIMAIVVFLIVKAINSVKNLSIKKEEEAPTVKVCPFCKSEVPIDATKCKFCASELEVEKE